MTALPFYFFFHFWEKWYLSTPFLGFNIVAVLMNEISSTIPYFYLCSNRYGLQKKMPAGKSDLNIVEAEGTVQLIQSPNDRCHRQIN